MRPWQAWPAVDYDTQCSIPRAAVIHRGHPIHIDTSGWDCHHLEQRDVCSQGVAQFAHLHHILHSVAHCRSDRHGLICAAEHGALRCMCGLSASTWMLGIRCCSWSALWMLSVCCSQQVSLQEDDWGPCSMLWSEVVGGLRPTPLRGCRPLRASPHLLRHAVC